MNKSEVIAKLKEMELPIVDKSDIGQTPELMRSLAEGVYQFEMSDIFVDLQNVEELKSSIGVVVTYADQTYNDGVYIFTVQEDSSISLIVVIPSTIATGPMIRRVSGDIISAITGLNLPTLSVFDKVEVAGHVVADTIITPMMDMLNIPQNKRTQFVMIYLPRFMANVAQQYIGSSTLKEEVVEMEPYMVKEMVLNEQPKQEAEPNEISEGD